MRRYGLPILLLTIFGLGPAPTRLAPAAWPHRAIVTALRERPVAFQAYTRGGILVIAVDASGRRTTTPAAIPTLRALTKDTIHADTPAEFPLDLSNGSVTLISDDDDSLNVVVARNPNGTVDRVSAKGRTLTVRMVGHNFVIDAR